MAWTGLEFDRGALWANQNNGVQRGTESEFLVLISRFAAKSLPLPDGEVIIIRGVQGWAELPGPFSPEDAAR